MVVSNIQPRTLLAVRCSIATSLGTLMGMSLNCFRLQNEAVAVRLFEGIPAAMQKNLPICQNTCYGCVSCTGTPTCHSVYLPCIVYSAVREHIIKWLQTTAIFSVKSSGSIVQKYIAFPRHNSAAGYVEHTGGDLHASAQTFLMCMHPQASSQSGVVACISPVLRINIWVIQGTLQEYYTSNNHICPT